jgi:hypothetical protein
MFKICHETPTSLFTYAKKFNDYDYYLDFLWEDKEYCDFFKKELEEGRTVIFDSSLFEFHPTVPPIDRFYEHIVDFGKYGKNIEYIVTDVLNNKKATIQKFEEWEASYRATAPGKAIGVVQGDSVDALDECYLYMSQHADKIAIPFDSAGFGELTRDITSNTDECDINTRLKAWSVGRRRYIKHLVSSDVWNNNKPHHLLGCSYAWEFADPLYKKISIESIDTSNPVVAGFLSLAYGDKGLSSKPPIKLVELIDAIPTKETLNLVLSNVAKFREIASSCIEEREIL